MPRHSGIFAVALTFIAVGFAAAAQTPPQSAASDATDAKTARIAGTPDGLSNDLLVDRREILQGEIRALTDQLGYLRDLRGYVSQLSVAKQQKNKLKQDELESRISELESWAGIQPDDKRDPKTLDASLAAKQADIDAKRQQLRAVDFEISSRLNSSAEKKAAQDFKTWMSGGFGLIIAFVIVGFFWTASRSTKVIEEIFSGQAGLQFITLFSLVIAIILFGITGVLEGKELSALLGGLAGYILGRSGVGASLDGRAEPKAAQNAKRADTAPAAQPVQQAG